MWKVKRTAKGRHLTSYLTSVCRKEKRQKKLRKVEKIQNDFFIFYIQSFALNRQNK